jgi:AraC-like DNA-binding protein
MLHQRFVGTDTRVVVTHEASLRSVVDVRVGRLLFVAAHGEVPAPARFVLALPPRSVVVMRFDGADVSTAGTGAPRALDGHRVPSLEALPAAASAHDAVARPHAVIARIDPDRGVPADLADARAALHDAIGALAPVRAAAARIGLRTETLARRFAAAYGITPKRYCQWARLFDAAVRLFDGASVVDAALEAGFNDIKRCYVQFRRLFGATPGQYAAIRKRQDGPTADR